MSPVLAISSVAKKFVVHRELVLEMTKRDLRVINKGSVLGFLWLILSPLIHAIAYAIIISVVFGARISNGSGMFSFALYVLAGMLPWQMILRSIAEAPTLITSRAEILKQVVYPVETLPTCSIAKSTIGGFASLIVYLLLAASSGDLRWSLLLLPLPIGILILFLLGVSWIFSVLGVIFKDLREITTVVLGLMIYFTPVLAMEQLTGPHVWKLILLNPLSHIIIAFRDVISGELHLTSWIIFTTMSTILFVLGAMLITRVRIRINDYL